MKANPWRDLSAVYTNLSFLSVTMCIRYIFRNRSGRGGEKVLLEEKAFFLLLWFREPKVEAMGKKRGKKLLLFLWRLKKI